MNSKNTGYAIICETWLTNIPTLIGPNYEIFQTTFSKHQGVWIILRKGWTQRWYTNKDPYMIAIQTKNQGKIHLVIGVYCKEITKEKILESLCKLLHRIKIKYSNSIITVYGDFNTNKNFSIEMIEKRTKLMIVKINKIAVTRVQKRKNELSCSTLDYFLINRKIKDFITVREANSDQLPVSMSINIKGTLSKKRLVFHKESHAKHRRN